MPSEPAAAPSAITRTTSKSSTASRSAWTVACVHGFFLFAEAKRFAKSQIQDEARRSGRVIYRDYAFTCSGSQIKAAEFRLHHAGGAACHNSPQLGAS